ncbi:FG-GAP-like repeat-containing protein [Streptomyces sp. NPDC056361]|uniref:FG-GAP-like repeat-containing protein n=1 Tax=Streptomyces sp. NPDC056361 TaxID=3345795 RepID=UPI0035D646B6
MRISIMRRLAAAATTLGLASLGLLGAGATPAQAAIGDCPAGYFCAWKSDNGTGTMYKTNVNQATLGSWDNAFRSIVNRTSKWLCLYDDANYTDPAGASVIPSDPAGTEWGGPGGNSVSSLKFVPTERECRGLAYPSWGAAASPAKAGFGDLNADKKADVLVRDEAGRLWFLPGDNTGRLVGTGGWGVMNALTRHGDFSGDGREDVIARETATGKLWLYPGTGTGTLGTRKLIGSGGWNAMAKLTAYGDLTGDDRSDLLAVEPTTGKLWLYPGTSAGTLGARKLLGTGGWNAMNALVAPGDMNGNGKADLITREASTGKLWLYPATASGTFGPRVLIGSGGWNVMASFLALGDFTGDGLNDLATVTTGSYSGEGCRGVGCLVLYSGKGTGGLNPGAPESQYVDWSDLRGTF